MLFKLQHKRCRLPVQLLSWRLMRAQGCVLKYMLKGLLTETACRLWSRSHCAGHWKWWIMFRCKAIHFLNIFLWSRNKTLEPSVPPGKKKKISITYLRQIENIVDLMLEDKQTKGMIINPRGLALSHYLCISFYIILNKDICPCWSDAKINSDSNCLRNSREPASGSLADQKQVLALR